MSEQTVSICINQKLASLSEIPSHPFIFRVDDPLRRENEKAYQPEILAIGPYHRGSKDNLRMMEDHKLRYLQQLLQRTNDSVDTYIMAMIELEDSARKCYAESINLKNDQFVEMMLLDGCFIIELLRKYSMRQLIHDNDLIFTVHPTLYALKRDLMLFENQLPFFILSRLFDMTKFSTPEDNDIIELARYFLADNLPRPRFSEASARAYVDNVENIFHLLDLMHQTWCSSYSEMVSGREVSHDGKWEFIKCVTKLRGAGIKFEKATTSAVTLFDIKFENGVMVIPPLIITDDTETLFRNFIAYEQYHYLIDRRCVTDYVIVMDHLIDSAYDVEKLGKYGIINNWLGNDEVVSTMFNNLCNNISIDFRSFNYSEVFNNVNIHYGKRQNIWLAKLKRNYFSNPWSIISFVAAFMLLLLTLVQTIFSILSF